MKNYFISVLLIFQIIFTFLTIGCQNLLSPKQSNDSTRAFDKLSKIDTSKSHSVVINSKDTSIISKMVGGWCYQEKDPRDSTIILKDFSLTLIQKEDSLFGEYNYVFGNGNHLNSSDGWSFKIRKETVLDTSLYFPFANAYDYTTLHLKLEYNRKDDILKWEVKEPYENNTHWIPAELDLHRCEPDKTDSLK